MRCGALDVVVPEDAVDRIDCRMADFPCDTDWNVSLQRKKHNY